MSDGRHPTPNQQVVDGRRHLFISYHFWLKGTAVAQQATSAEQINWGHGRRPTPNEQGVNGRRHLFISYYF